MKLKAFFQKIGQIFTDMFDAAERAWHKLSPEIQKAFTAGSGIMEMINSGIDKLPADLRDAILAKFGLTEDQLKAGLLKVAQALNLGEDLNDADLLTLIGKVQAYLDKHEGEQWAGISALASKVMAFFLAPAGSKWAVFETLMEYVYQTFVKKEA